MTIHFEVGTQTPHNDEIGRAVGDLKFSDNKRKNTLLAGREKIIHDHVRNAVSSITELGALRRQGRNLVGYEGCFVAGDCRGMFDLEGEDNVLL